jgi:hypothetical protein
MLVQRRMARQARSDGSRVLRVQLLLGQGLRERHHC